MGMLTGKRMFRLLNRLYDRLARARQKDWEHNLQQSLGACGTGVDLFPYSSFVQPSSIFIGNNVHIRGNVYFQGAGGLYIDDNVFISRNCTIFTVTHNYHGDLLPYDANEIKKPVRIGRNVWIGMNVTIIPGVTVGEGAIIGIGTVVTEDVPPLAIVVSRGGKILKYRDREHYERLNREGRFCAWGGVPLNE